ncbi:hypothetical protein J6590_078589 [Homalodisca vitripennis]|nr:hypothetical protein J6590_078589 [Homalodisca vitripennis]
MQVRKLGRYNIGRVVPICKDMYGKTGRKSKFKAKLKAALSGQARTARKPASELYYNYNLGVTNSCPNVCCITPKWVHYLLAQP